jgi:hypothetical protein
MLGFSRTFRPEKIKFSPTMLQTFLSILTTAPDYPEFDPKEILEQLTLPATARKLLLKSSVKSSPPKLPILSAQEIEYN